MDLILASMARCGEGSVRWDGNIDGDAECDSLHTGSDQKHTLCDERGCGGQSKQVVSVVVRLNAC
jgi:hypothetical protein